MGLPPGPTSPGFGSDSGSSSAGKRSRALTGDADVLARISPDGVAVDIAAVAVQTLLVPAPPRGYVRIVQRAIIHDNITAGNVGISELFISTSPTGATYDELLDRDEQSVAAAGESAKTAKARLLGPIALRGAAALWCTASVAGEAGARYFDILLQD